MDRLLALLLVCCLAVSFVAAAPVGADHGSPSNFTAIPYDTQPGLDDASYEQRAVAPISIQYLDYIRASWDEGGFTGCGPTNIQEFGIDRNNDDPGTSTDEGLRQYVEESKVGEDEFVANFYEKDDAFGSSTNLNQGDEFISVTSDCFDNPDQPGWYQIRSTIGGTAPNGTYIEVRDISHYFYICDCANEQQAREALGPPPSEPTPTPTATATATAEPTPTRTPPEEGTPFPSPTPTATPKQSTPTPDPMTANNGATATAASAASGPDNTGGSGGGDSIADSGTPSPTPQDWDSYVRETPTVGSGPGFGSIAAVLALVAVALLGLRRD